MLDGRPGRATADRLVAAGAETTPWLALVLGAYGGYLAVHAPRLYRLRKSCSPSQQFSNTVRYRDDSPQCELSKILGGFRCADFYYAF